MMRWNEIAPVVYFKYFTAKLYRPMFVPESSVNAEHKPEYGLDRYAKDHLGSELYNYKMVDTNRVQIAECFGDLDRIKKLKVPIE